MRSNAVAMSFRSPTVRRIEWSSPAARKSAWRSPCRSSSPPKASAFAWCRCRRRARSIVNPSTTANRCSLRVYRRSRSKPARVRSGGNTCAAKVASSASIASANRRPARSCSNILDSRRSASPTPSGAATRPSPSLPFPLSRLRERAGVRASLRHRSTVALIRLPAPSSAQREKKITIKRTIMALISLKQLLDHAAEHAYGLPAFNVNNMEQIHAIMQAAEDADSPVILQASAGARSYAGEPFLRHLVLAAVEQWPNIPVCLHQDHGASPAVCQASIRSGFTSVMMDGSLKEDMKTPASYEYNVMVTRRVVDMAHAVGVSVEGELGCLGSLETGTAGEEDGSGAEGTLDHSQLLTDPDQAADFVAKTGVDALAVAIGTSHGAYKFTRPPTGDILDIERIKAIHARIPSTHLVMHGSSSVPQEWLKVIRDN